MITKGPSSDLDHYSLSENDAIIHMINIHTLLYKPTKKKQET